MSKALRKSAATSSGGSHHSHGPEQQLKKWTNPAKFSIWMRAGWWPSHERKEAKRYVRSNLLRCHLFKDKFRTVLIMTKKDWRKLSFISESHRRFSFAIPHPFHINFQLAQEFEPNWSWSVSFDLPFRLSNKVHDQISLIFSYFSSISLFIPIKVRPRHPAAPCASPAREHISSPQIHQSGPTPQWRSDYPRLRTIPIPGNKVQQTSTDFCAQLRICATGQAHHAKVLAFCASGTSVQWNVVRRRMWGPNFMELQELGMSKTFRELIEPTDAKRRNSRQTLSRVCEPESLSRC
jgi:hypothetical protein